MQFVFDKKEQEFKLQREVDTGNLKEKEQAYIINSQQLALRNKELALTNQEIGLQRLEYFKEKAEKREKEIALTKMECEYGLTEMRSKSER